MQSIGEDAWDDECEPEQAVWCVESNRKEGVTRTKATKTVRMAGSKQYSGTCGRKFLDAEVKSPLAPDEGNIVVFRPQESYIENTSTGQRIPMGRRKSVLVVQ